MTERQIHVIKARRKMPKPFLNVGVYCRVSTPSQEQLHSLAAQVSHFVRKYHDLYNYRLYDVYIDVVSGAKTLARPEYQRMLEDCRGGHIEISLPKWIQSHKSETALKPLEIRHFTAFAPSSTALGEGRFSVLCG